MAESLDDLIKRIHTLELLTQEQINSIWEDVGVACTEVDWFLQSALRQGFLTNYQTERLLSGDSVGFYFGPYKALYLVGAGTFARVFRAVHRETGQVVAVKVLRARFSDNEAFINHFRTEGRLVSALNHPNIVPVYGVESAGFQHFMVMDFVEGQTLREFLKARKKVDPKTVVQIGIDICSGLEYALKMEKLPHRDLKLSNVLLSSGGQSRIVDFGLASIAQSVAGADIPFLKNQQSIDYIALEKASGAPKMDNRSDLYFLGCMLYHLVTGISPFPITKDRTKRLDRNRFFSIKLVQTVEPGLPASLSFLINKSMTVGPDQRYQSPTEMLVDLRGVLKRIEVGLADETAASLRFDGLQAAQEDRKNRLAKLRSATVMIVDSNPKTRHGLETLMQKLSYKTVSVADPDDIMKEFGRDDVVAQCILFNGQSLGMRAVRGFNDFAQRRALKDVAAILLLGESQESWSDAVTPQHHRVVLNMPVKVKQFREALIWLLDGYGKNLENSEE